MSNNAFRCKAPHHISFFIALILYVLAILAHFGVIPIPANVALWMWIGGFGLLLLAVRFKGL